MKPSKVHKENQSAMPLEANGHKSSSKWEQHMNVCYFFMEERIIVRYCPTDKIIDYFFMKPLSESNFLQFHNIIMNCSCDNFGPVDIDKIIKEHHKRIGACDVKDNDPWYLKHQQQQAHRSVLVQCQKKGGCSLLGQEIARNITM